MPYKTTADIKVSGVQKLPENAKRAFMHAFNSAWDSGKDETACIKIAWAAAKRAGAKKESIMSNIAKVLAELKEEKSDKIYRCCGELADFEGIGKRKCKKCGAEWKRVEDGWSKTSKIKEAKAEMKCTKCDWSGAAGDCHCDRGGHNEKCPKCGAAVKSGMFEGAMKHSLEDKIEAMCTCDGGISFEPSEHKKSCPAYKYLKAEGY